MSLLRSYLEAHSILDGAQLEAADRHQQAQGGSLDTALLELGLLNAGDLDLHLGRACGLPTVPARLLETGPTRPWGHVPKALLDIGWAMPLALEDGNVLVAVHPDLPDARLGQLYRQIRGFMPMVAPECCLAKLAAERSNGIVAPRFAMLMLDVLDALQARDAQAGAAVPEDRSSDAAVPADRSHHDATTRTASPGTAPATLSAASSGTFPISSASGLAAHESGTFSAASSGTFPASSSGTFPDLRSVGAHAPGTRHGPADPSPSASPPVSQASTAAPVPQPSPAPVAAPVSQASPAAPVPQASPAPLVAPVPQASPAPPTAPVPQASPAPATAPVPQASPAAPVPQASPAAPVPQTSPAPAAAPVSQTSPAAAPRMHSGSSLAAPVTHEPGRAEDLARRLAPARAALAAARERDQITESLVHAAAQIAPRVALFGVRREGLRVLAVPGALALSSALVIPIPEGSLLDRAVLGLIHLKLLAEPRLAAAVGRPLGIPCLFEPVFAQERGVLMLYIDRDGGLFDAADHAALRELCDLASADLEALLRTRGVVGPRPAAPASAANPADNSPAEATVAPVSKDSPATAAADPAPVPTDSPAPVPTDSPAAVGPAPVPTDSPAAAVPTRIEDQPSPGPTAISGAPRSEADAPQLRPGRAARAAKRQVISLINPIRRDSAGHSAPPTARAEPRASESAPAGAAARPGSGPLVAPVPTDSQQQPVPTDSQQQPVPTDSQQQPVPTDSQQSPVPTDRPAVDPAPPASTSRRHESSATTSTISGLIVDHEVAAAPVPRPESQAVIIAPAPRPASVSAPAPLPASVPVTAEPSTGLASAPEPASVPAEPSTGLASASPPASAPAEPSTGLASAPTSTQPSSEAVPEDTLTPSPAPDGLHLPNLVAPPGTRRGPGKKGDRARAPELVMPDLRRRSDPPAAAAPTLSIPTSLIAPTPLPGAQRRGSRTGHHPVPPRADEITLNMPRLVRKDVAAVAAAPAADLSPGPAATATDMSPGPATTATDRSPLAGVTIPADLTRKPAPATIPALVATAADAPAAPPAGPEPTPEAAAAAATTTTTAAMDPTGTERSAETSATERSAETSATDLSAETSATAAVVEAIADAMSAAAAAAEVEDDQSSETAPAAPQAAAAAAAPRDADAALEAYLNDPDDADARAALTALGPEGLERVAARFPGPIDLGDQSDARSFPPPSAHGPLLRACVEIGPAITPYILELLEYPRPQLRFYAAFVFQELRDPRCLRSLAQHAFDPDAEVRLIATRVLESYSRDEAFVAATELVRAELRSRDRERALLAAEAAGTLRDTRAVYTLIELLSVRDKQVRETALEALCSITAKHLGYRPAKWRAWYDEHGQETRVEWVIEALRHRDAAVRRWAADELVRITGHRVTAPAGEKMTAKHLFQAWQQWWTAGAADRG